MWYWDNDNHLLVTHTVHLKDAHEALNLRGIFETDSAGTNLEEQNCFCAPLRNGAWAVRRFSPGIQEHETWMQDGRGWTRCYFNKYPDLATAARSQDGHELEKGGFRFAQAELMIKAAQQLGVYATVPAAIAGREGVMVIHKDKRRLVLKVKHEPNDLGAEGWNVEGKFFVSIHNMRTDNSHDDEAIMNDFDEAIRHMVTSQDESGGWAIKAGNNWQIEPLTHIKAALSAMGVKSSEKEPIVGSFILKSWRLVNRPFEGEYPGNREWNRNAAKLRYTPSKSDTLKYDTWLKVLEHCGSGLNDAVREDPWCRNNSILTGGDYLKCWVASLFQKPYEPLPYLFLYGPQNSGKSILHESISLLFTRGAKRADAALISQSGFNEELEGCVLAIIEEIDLNKDKTAYNRIKDWVTSKEILIHGKGKTPYHMPNTSHWIQCSNEGNACPIFQGDTRITMCFVGALDPIDMIPKRQLIEMLETEAPDFLSEIMDLDLPASNDRLNIPVLQTADKAVAAEGSKSDIQDFFDELCFYIPGQKIKYSDLHDRYVEWCMHEGIEAKRIRQFGKQLPPEYVKGRDMQDGAQWYIGNISFVPKDDSAPRLRRLTVRNAELVISNDD